MSEKPVVVLGILGTRLDGGTSGKRWRRWRPTVDVVRHPELGVRRVEVLHGGRDLRWVRRVLDDLEELSPGLEARAHEVAFDDPWDFEEVYERLYEFARGYPFVPEEEDYLVHVTTGSHVMQICLFLLTESRLIPGRLLQTSPPEGRDRSVPGRYDVIDLDLSRYDSLAARFQRERREDLAFLKAGIDTQNPEFNRVIEELEVVAGRSDAPILVRGPTGAGKSQLARRIYALKRRRRQVEGALVEVNCATLRGDQAMSTLFGHVPGAFTGAVKAREGLLRRADGGVLFLDEVGELGLDEQAMLLRAIEEGRFTPLGSDREVESRFQLVAGTHRDLRGWVAEGRFRDDLLARIDVWSVRLPGLRERPEDVGPNVEVELQRAGERLGVHVTMNREARAAFVAFASGPEGRWPRNFRDFSGAVLRMATLAEGGRITGAEVAREVERLRGQWAGDGGWVGRVLGAEVELDAFERIQLEGVLAVCARAASLSAAGRELFACSRLRRKSVNDADRLRKYLAKYGVTWERVQASRGRVT